MLSSGIVLEHAACLSDHGVVLYRSATVSRVCKFQEAASIMVLLL